MRKTRRESMEIVQRLRAAHKQTKKLFDGEEVVLELHAGTEIARYWPIITASYSGLEQTIKYLIAEEKGMGTQELIGQSIPGQSRSGRRRKQVYPYRTHNIAWLFSKLGEPTQSVLHEFYERFQSLHSYIPILQLDEFLQKVSANKGTGYERWRYALIENRKLPPNSPAALVAIWGVCVRIAISNIWSNQRVRMPDEMIVSDLRNQLNAWVRGISINRQNAGEPYQEIQPEIHAWLHASGHPLNAFARVLWHFRRYESHGVADASDWFSEVLLNWRRHLLEATAQSGPTLLRMFVERAQGNTPQGASLSWNSAVKRFEAVPWALEERHQSELPLGAIKIGGDHDQWPPLRDLWSAAQQCGYRVLENRSFHGGNQHDNWFCTLQVQSENERKTNAILSIWEKPIEQVCYLVRECPCDAIAAPVRRWIGLAEAFEQAS